MNDKFIEKDYKYAYEISNFSGHNQMNELNQFSGKRLQLWPL